MEIETPQVKKRKVEDEEASPTPIANLLVKRLSENAKLPTRGSALAAGYDLYRYIPSVKRPMTSITYFLSARRTKSFLRMVKP